MKPTTQVSGSCSGHKWDTRFRKRTLPVGRNFLWEKGYDEAWQEASAGGCSESGWLRLAATREEKYPGDAVPIYKEMIAPTLKQANNAAYAEAVKLLRKIRQLMARLGCESEFEDYLVALRVEYKRKRNFIKLVQGIEKLEIKPSDV